MGETILKMQGIQKYFSGVHALNGVNFDLRAGEVHALMGENGAGKSTLIKVLCGIHAKDGGTIEYLGKEVAFADIAESQDAGISVIDGAFVGDVDEAAAAEKAAAYAPVSDGVGAVTVSLLMGHTVEAARRSGK